MLFKSAHLIPVSPEINRSPLFEKDFPFPASWDKSEYAAELKRFTLSTLTLLHWAQIWCQPGITHAALPGSHNDGVSNGSHFFFL